MPRLILSFHLWVAILPCPKAPLQSILLEIEIVEMAKPYMEDPQKTMKGPMMVETHADIRALLYQLQSRVPLYPKMDNNNGTCNKPKINSYALEIKIFS
jgi:hypothetical protein